MGFWGSQPYANDTTCDVRDMYVKFLEQQQSGEQAYKATLEYFKEYIGDEEESLFWYALADTQWNLGRLMPQVKENALNWIEKNGGLELWRDSTSKGKDWITTIEKMQAKLDLPMPPEKKRLKNRSNLSAIPGMSEISMLINFIPISQKSGNCLISICCFRNLEMRNIAMVGFYQLCRFLIKYLMNFLN